MTKDKILVVGECMFNKTGQLFKHDEFIMFESVDWSTKHEKITNTYSVRCMLRKLKKIRPSPCLTVVW